MYHPTLDSFNVSLSMAGAQTYGMLTLPPSQSGDAVAAHVEQIVQITDVDAFTQYNLALLTSEIFSPRVNGSTWLHQGGLPATYVNFDKTVQIKGELNHPHFYTRSPYQEFLSLLFFTSISTRFKSKALSDSGG